MTTMHVDMSIALALCSLRVDCVVEPSIVTDKARYYAHLPRITPGMTRLLEVLLVRVHVLERSGTNDTGKLSATTVRKWMDCVVSFLDKGDLVFRVLSQVLLEMISGGEDLIALPALKCELIFVIALSASILHSFLDRGDSSLDEGRSCRLRSAVKCCSSRSFASMVLRDFFTMLIDLFHK